MPADLGRRVDQRDVRERLREVPDKAAGHRVVLLGEETEVIAKADQAVQHLAGVTVPPSMDRQSLNQNEHGEERPLPAGQSVDLEVSSVS